MRKFTIVLVFLFVFPASVLAFTLPKVKFINAFAFDRPSGLAVDEEGRIYIVDQKHKAIKVVTEDGKVVLSWGGKDKTKRWRLKKPAGIAIYKDRVYITDSAQGNVLIFSKDGNYIDSFGSKGSRPKQFKNPGGIYVFGGVIYVADTGNRRVQVFGPNGIYMDSIGTTGTEEQRVQGPVDVAVDYRGYIYVLDSKKTNRLQVYKPSGEHLRGISGFDRPAAMAMDKDGFFVADTGNYNFKKYNFKGKLLFSFGIEGKDRGQFRKISGIAVDAGGKVIVADSRNRNVQVFAPEKTTKAVPENAPPPTSVKWLQDIKFSKETGFSSADKLFANGKGKLYAVTAKEKSIVVLKDGKVERVLKLNKVKPVAAARDRDGFWVVDEKKNNILKVDNNGNTVFTIGSKGKKKGQFRKPPDIAISKKDFIYIVDSGNKRIQVFNTDGMFVAVVAEDGGFESPSAIALDSADNMFILDGKKHEISKLSPEGKPLLSFGKKGKGPGEFEKPAGIAVANNEVFVLDQGNSRIQVFSPAGKFLRAFGTKGKGKGDFQKPASLAMDGTVLFVSDAGNKRIQTIGIVYTPDPPANPNAAGGMRQINLTWTTDDSPGFIEQYKVYRALSPSAGFKEIAAVRTDHYTDRDVEPDKSYFYRVTAVAREGNESLKSKAADARATKYIPSQPRGVIVTPADRDVTLSWQPNTETFVNQYAVYREVEGTFKLLGKTQSPSFMDKSVRPDTKYIYKVTAFSTDNVESEATELKITTLKATKPPVEITVLMMRDIFSNTYKNYEKEGIGEIRVLNNTWNQISKLKISFTIKEYMDFPTEVHIENLAPRQSVDIGVKPIFNNKILSVTENTPVQMEIKASYYENQKLKTYTKNYTVQLYEKHYLTWDVRDRMGTFITPKDAPVLEFAREIARQYPDLQDPVIYARGIFDALGIIGTAYLPDPSNPYQITSGKTDYVDYVQYPRETLKRKSGDCDDLVNLYSASLESIGIRTVLLDTPGHIFMMFSTNIKADEGKGAADEMYAIHEDLLWVPVEVTKVGSSFLEAWKKGIEIYREWEGKGLEIVDLRKAWAKFKPASLPASDWRPETVKRADIEEKFGDELDYLRKLRIRFKSREYLAILKEHPEDVYATLKLGILYGESGEPQEALKMFKKALSYDPGNPSVKNNIGNIYFLQNKYEEAKKAYEEAAKLDPTDPYIWVNLSRCYLRLNMNKEAKEAFDRAGSLDPDVSKKYLGLSLELEKLESLGPSETSDEGTKPSEPSDEGTKSSEPSDESTKHSEPADEGTKHSEPSDKSTKP